ncbi:aspartic peptidase domain-containing protein [Suillus spraguei]|nr:aspartic peptidase domain-containing protein [Suillus spraguei]
MFYTAFLLTLLLTLPIIGSPVEVRNSVVTLPLTRRLNFSNGTINLVQHDEARFRDGRRADSIPVTNTYFQYTAAVGIGSPPTIYNLVVDSGSSVTWVDTTAYVETGTNVNTKQPVAETYGVVENCATFSEKVAQMEKAIQRQRENAITQHDVVDNMPAAICAYIWTIFLDILTLGTLPGALYDTIPTVTDYLVNQGKIGQHIVGIFFQPGTDLREVTFGRSDYNKYIDNIVYTHITATSPSSDFWGINQRITYGTTSILDPTAGYATGTTLDAVTRLLCLSPDQYMVLRNLDFHIGNEIFSLTPNSQIWPRSLNYKLHGGVQDGIYLIIADLGKPTDSWLDFVIGYLFMQCFYNIYKHK